MKLAGRTALITGASRGIGRAIALAFAAEGANLAITARSRADLDQLTSLVTESESEQRVRCLPIVADLSTADCAEVIYAEFAKSFDRLDILVNNAGVGSSIDPRPLVEFNNEIWDLTFAVNVKAPYLLCKKFVPGMIENKYGRIVNVASLAAKMGLLHGSAYAASKHALLGLTRSLAQEVVSDGISVNAICPGAVRTASNEPRLVYDAARLGKSRQDYEATMTPLGRRLEPEEMTPMAVYLASEEARVVTGQAFNIDAGVTMW